MCPESNQIVISYLKLISRRIHSCSRHDFDNCENITLVVESCCLNRIILHVESPSNVALERQIPITNANSRLK